jgi:hypothetical protein
MHRYGQSSMAGCPHNCGCDSEDHQHLLHCPSQECQDMFLPLQTDFDTLYEKSCLDPLLWKAFLVLLSPYWGEQVDFDLPTAYSDLILFQQDLHPDSVFMGCLSTDWTKILHSARARLGWQEAGFDPVDPVDSHHLPNSTHFNRGSGCQPAQPRMTCGRGRRNVAFRLLRL